MKKKIRLTDKEFEIYRKQKRDTAYTDGYIRNIGLNPNVFAEVDGKLLDAQSQARELLKNYSHFLTKDQIKTLKRFGQKMRKGEIRKKLKPEAAYPIFNITTKVVRILHRQAQYD
jgi:hypothetical protein